MSSIVKKDSMGISSSNARNGTGSGIVGSGLIQTPTIGERCSSSSNCSTGLVCQSNICRNTCHVQAPSNDCTKIVMKTDDDTYEEAKIECNNAYYMYTDPQGQQTARTCYWDVDGFGPHGCEAYTNLAQEYLEL